MRFLQVDAFGLPCNCFGEPKKLRERLVRIRTIFDEPFGFDYEVRSPEVSDGLVATKRTQYRSPVLVEAARIASVAPFRSHGLLPSRCRLTHDVQHQTERCLAKFAIGLQQVEQDIAGQSALGGSLAHHLQDRWFVEARFSRPIEPGILLEAGKNSAADLGIGRF